MRALETAADGRRFAIAALRALREDGPERCRANTPPRYARQADALILALIEIKERATVEACAGFGQIITDALGARCLEPAPELYERMERYGEIRPYKLKRLVNRGQRLAVLALRREAMDASGNGSGMPAKAEPAPSPAPENRTARQGPLCAADLNGTEQGRGWREV